MKTADVSRPYVPESNVPFLLASFGGGTGPDA